MRVLSAMGLTMWDQLDDPYDHVQLANNIAKLDQHDHTPGRGVQITTQSIEGESITTALLAAGSVTAPKIASEAVKEEALIKALKDKMKEILVVKSYATGAELKSGELGLQTKNGETFTLPSAATANQVIGVFSGSGATTKVTASGGAAIYGDFTNAAGSINLAPLQHVILQSGGSEWLIVGGEPKREQVYGTWTARTPNTEYEPSATRMTHVITECTATSAGWSAQLSIGGEGGVAISGEASRAGSLSFLVPAGVKWKIAMTGTAAAIHSQYMML